MARNSPKRSVRRERADHEKYSEYFRLYYRDVWHVFRRMGFDLERCRDLTQDTFTSGYRGFDRFRKEASFRTWILKIAENLAINGIRSLKAEKRQATEVHLDGMPDGGDTLLDKNSSHPVGATPLEDTLAKERQLRLRTAIDSLPTQMRQCIYMYVYQELKYREIADLLGISINTVKSQIFQAKERLRSLLGQFLDEASDSQDSEP